MAECLVDLGQFHKVSKLRAATRSDGWNWSSLLTRALRTKQQEDNGNGDDGGDDEHLKAAVQWAAQDLIPAHLLTVQDVVDAVGDRMSLTRLHVLLSSAGTKHGKNSGQSASDGAILVEVLRAHLANLVNTTASADKKRSIVQQMDALLAQHKNNGVIGGAPEDVKELIKEYLPWHALTSLKDLPEALSLYLHWDACKWPLDHIWFEVSQNDACHQAELHLEILKILARKDHGMAVTFGKNLLKQRQQNLSMRSVLDVLLPDPPQNGSVGGGSAWIVDLLHDRLHSVPSQKQSDGDEGVGEGVPVEYLRAIVEMGELRELQWVILNCPIALSDTFKFLSQEVVNPA